MRTCSLTLHPRQRARLLPRPPDIRRAFLEPAHPRPLLAAGILPWESPVARLLAHIIRERQRLPFCPISPELLARSRTSKRHMNAHMVARWLDTPMQRIWTVEEYSTK